MTLKTTIALNVSSRLTADADLDADAVREVRKVYDVTLRNGTGPGQAAKLYADENNLGASANIDIDLAGALSDGIGGTAVFGAIKGLVVYALPTNVNNVVIGAAAANPWTALLGATHTAQVKPGTTLAVFVDEDSAGYPVVAGTGDILRVANGGAGTAVDYEIIIIGT